MACKRLLLTHYWGHVPPEAMIAEAREAFEGPISVAKERKTYLIGKE